VNVHELDDFIRICADLKVDRMVLRPLNYSDGIGLDWEREGYRYRYQDELLPFGRLVFVSGRAAELCRRLGVSLADQMDFGGSMGDQFQEQFEAGRQSVTLPAAPAVEAVVDVPASAGPAPDEAPAARREPVRIPLTPIAAADPEEPLPSLGTERRPVCLEPWKSLYILRRGVFPCCYGGAPVAPMSQHREAWNSPVLQAIRGELAAGRFHDYCLRSPSCPIIRKSEKAHALPASQMFRLRARKLWNRLDRMTGGAWGKAYRGTKWVAIRAARALTSPSYVGHHAKRLVGRASGPARSGR